MITDREQRLRQRIDVLTDERDRATLERDTAVTELRAVKADIKAARISATKLSSEDGAHVWLAEYDRRRALRTSRRRSKRSRVPA